MTRTRSGNQNQPVSADFINRPIVVGGVGGSGTRVVAQILQQLDYHIGAELNGAKDNLWFTLLFRRRRLLENARNQGDAPVHRMLQLFELSTFAYRTLNRDELLAVLRAVPETCWYWGIGPSLRVDKALRTTLSLIRQPTCDWEAFRGWGWKEPNAQLFLPYLSSYFSNMRYIQVIRHGLDMAYSRNQYQLHYWGHLFGIDRPKIAESLPRASLDYWIQSNEQAIRWGRELLADRFFILNLDRFCQYPAEEVKRLVHFLDVHVDQKLLEALSALPQVPRSTGRYKQAGIEVFRPDQIEKVRQLGFEVE